MALYYLCANCQYLQDAAEVDASDPDNPPTCSRCGSQSFAPIDVPTGGPGPAPVNPAPVPALNWQPDPRLKRG